MDHDPFAALTLPLTPTEQDQVKYAATITGQSVDEFLRTAVLAAATDPFLAALDQAADTVAASTGHEPVQHDYAAG
ncbi:hypothetical protein [Streptomyces rubiginosohelvolus]|uniref:hypothetical protein n=1 Tax=Streptomyces rubiginosohelvolus TaxID=67362 RepID=UPI0035DA11AE